MSSRGRIVGIDLGSKRIGVAVTDFTATLASPLVVIQRSGDVKSDHRRIGAIVAEEEAVRVVVGLPVDLRGKIAIAASAAIAEAEQLATFLSVPVETFDERMTTATAAKRLAENGVSSKKRRDTIDMYAAAVMLQGYLDAKVSNE